MSGREWWCCGVSGEMIGTGFPETGLLDSRATTDCWHNRRVDCSISAGWGVCSLCCARTQVVPKEVCDKAVRDSNCRFVQRVSREVRIRRGALDPAVNQQLSEHWRTLASASARDAREWRSQPGIGASSRD